MTDRGKRIRRLVTLAAIWAAIAAAAAAITTPDGLVALGAVSVPLVALLLARTARPGCRQCGAEGSLRSERTAKVTRNLQGGWDVVREETTSCEDCGWQESRRSRSRAAESVTRRAGGNTSRA